MGSIWLGIGDLDHDLVDRVRPEQAHLTGLERNHDGVVLVARGPLAPLLASTPTTVNGTLRMRISWPIGDWPFGNRLVATVWPRTATFFELVLSWLGEGVPWAIVQSLMVRYSGATAWTGSTSSDCRR